MLKRLINHLALTYRIHSLDQLLDLITPDEHPAFLQEHRSRLIFDRVRFLATLFALLMPLWAIIDALLLPLEILLPILVIRAISTTGFILQARSWDLTCNHHNSWLIMGLLLINLPITFFASAHYLLSQADTGSTHLAIQLYTLLPYIAIGLLGLFPLTAMEGALLALPLTLITITGWSFYASTEVLQLLPTVWLLFIILVIVFFSSTLQLQYMISLITHADFDPVTGALTRRSGMENLNREFEKATLNSHPLSVTLITVDDMQAIIEKHEYATFDHVIVEAADILREGLRNNDLLTRWTENSFLLILPGTDCSGASVTVNRIQNKGIGSLPDGKPVTASIAVVERRSDHLETIPGLLRLLEQRVDEAKQQGNDTAILCKVL